MYLVTFHPCRHLHILISLIVSLMVKSFTTNLEISNLKTNINNLKNLNVQVYWLRLKTNIYAFTNKLDVLKLVFLLNLATQVVNCTSTIYKS